MMRRESVSTGLRVIVRVLAVLVAVWMGLGDGWASEAFPQQVRSVAAGEEAAAVPSEEVAGAGASLTVMLAYDPVRRLVGLDYGNGVTIAYTYDAAGNLLRREVTVPAPVERTGEGTVRTYLPSVFSVR